MDKPELNDEKMELIGKAESNSKSEKANIGDAQKLREKLKYLTEMAKKKKNVLEYTEINEAMQELNLNQETLDKVYDYLEKNNIDIIGNMEETLVEELDLSIPDSIRLDDPVRLYLKEIGKVG